MEISTGERLFHFRSRAERRNRTGYRLQSANSCREGIDETSGRHADSRPDLDYSRPAATSSQLALTPWLKVK